MGTADGLSDWSAHDAHPSIATSHSLELSPERFHVPFYLDSVPEIGNFVGRESTRSLIEQSLLSSTERRRKVAYIHGMGGMGRTQLAIHYATHFRDRYTAILWFDAKDEDSLRKSFVKNADRLPEGAIPQAMLDNQQASPDVKKLIQAVKHWLESPANDQWLLIFDNVDNPKIPQNQDESAYDIRPYFPEASHGSIVITTRWASFGIGPPIGLSKLATDESGLSLSILEATSHRSDLHKGESDKSSPRDPAD